MLMSLDPRDIYVAADGSVFLYHSVLEWWSAILTKSPHETAPAKKYFEPIYVKEYTHETVNENYILRWYQPLTPYRELEPGDLLDTVHTRIRDVYNQGYPHWPEQLDLMPSHLDEHDYNARWLSYEMAERRAYKDDEILKAGGQLLSMDHIKFQPFHDKYRTIMVQLGHGDKLPRRAGALGHQEVTLQMVIQVTEENREGLALLWGEGTSGEWITSQRAQDRIDLAQEDIGANQHQIKYFSQQEGRIFRQ